MTLLIRACFSIMMSVWTWHRSLEHTQLKCFQSVSTTIVSGRNIWVQVRDVVAVLNILLCLYHWHLRKAPLDLYTYFFSGPSLSWSYRCWIYDYLCNQCPLPLTLWVRILLRRGVVDTTLCDKVCQWLMTGWWFSPGTLVSSTNKTDHHDIDEILLKVALNPIFSLSIYF